MTKRQEINKQLDGFKAELEESTLTHKWTTPDVVRKRAEWILAHPDERSAWEQAHDDVEIWDTSNRPRGDGQGNLFEPNAIIPTGQKSGERISMRYAKRIDLYGWRSIEVDTFEARRIDHEQKLRYIDSRLAVFNESVFPTLEHLEANKFPK
jgi:hypothetical protein